MKPNKLNSLIMFILSQAGRELGAVELAKIVYLIDLEKVILSGDTITGEKYTRREKGPLAVNFQKSITQMDGFELNVTVDAKSGNSAFPKHKHTLGKKPRFQPVLDLVELAVAKRVLIRITNFSPIQIERLAYDSEPMKLILSKEEKAGHLILGEEIDFSVVKPNTVLENWRQNRKKTKPHDKKFDEFLIQERAEIDELLTSLGE